jgi:hypothetical protein
MNRGSSPKLKISACDGAPILACAHCISAARSNEDPIEFAVTIIDGNATCAAHLEPVFTELDRRTRA